MNNQRPKNLNLFSISFPAPAIASILHRISGVILFLSIPLIIWVFANSLRSEDDFRLLQDHLNTPFAKLLIWGLLAPFLYHFVAGIRHLLMDVNLGVSLKGGKVTAVGAMLIATVLIILAGVYVW